MVSRSSGTALQFPGSAGILSPDAEPGSMSPVDELAGWAQAARDGDPVAVAALVRATQRDVHRLCAHLVDAASADDFAQDTYVRALGALAGYRGARAVPGLAAQHRPAHLRRCAAVIGPGGGRW